MFLRRVGCIFQHNAPCTINRRFLVNAQIRSLSITSVLCGKVIPFKLSDIGEGIAEVQVKEWFVKVGEAVKQFDNVCEVQSDKASVTITSRYDGVVKHIHYNVDDIARVGQPLIDIELEDDSAIVPGEVSSEPDEKASKTCPAVPSDSVSNTHTVPKPIDAAIFDKVLATPAVRRIAIENHITLKDVSGTGRDGRILKEDVLNFLSRQGSLPPPETVDMPRPHFQRGEDRIQPIRGYMRAMVKSMSQAAAIPHFVYCDEVNVDRLVDLRRQLKHLAKEKRVKMSYMPLFIKAASLALHHYPVLNSSLDSSAQNITYKAAHNISIAMDTPDGLVVPNIKHCEERSIWEIAGELNRLQEAGAKCKLTTTDLADGTFGLSNIGAIGAGTYAAPIVFIPQVVIGALGSIRVLPRYDDSMELKPTHSVNVSWAADHRLVDGATMARFSMLWKKYLENPALMIAEMK